MNSERLNMKGKLSENKLKLKEIEISADGLITLIRMKLNPYDNLKKLPIKEIHRHMTDLLEKKKKHQELFEEITKLEEALGDG